MLNVTFNEVDHALEEAQARISAAEAHGWLCGALCSPRPLSAPAWFEELLEDDVEDAAREAAMGESGPLHVLYADTATALNGMEMDFSPLLPDDDLPLDRRSESLSQWCQGFLYGFGAHQGGGPRGGTGSYTAEVEEVMRDLAQIARIPAEESEGSEEEEEAYAELVEFVRISVQLVHDELADRTSSASARPH
jgi:yecA family protein